MFDLMLEAKEGRSNDMKDLALGLHDMIDVIGLRQETKGNYIPRCLWMGNKVPNGHGSLQQCS
jgi:hypothetical protein